MRTRTVLLAIALSVGIALIPAMPYGYYFMMRWIVCTLCAWLALTAYRSGHEGWAWTWGIIAGIYNPIFRVHATRELWSIVNILTIVIAAWYGLKTGRKGHG